MSSWDKLETNIKFTLEPNFSTLLNNLKPGDKVLDFGCGYGRHCNIFNENKIEYIGYDNSTKLIERAKKENPNFADRFISDLSLIPNLEKFDAVILIAVLTAIPDDCDQAESISIVKKLMKPDGLLFVSDFLLNQDQRNIDRYNDFTVRNIYPYGVFEGISGLYLRHHSLSWFDELFFEFEVIEKQELKVNTLQGNSSNGIEILLRKK